jgi:hypothetical protein
MNCSWGLNPQRGHWLSYGQQVLGLFLTGSGPLLIRGACQMRPVLTQKQIAAPLRSNRWPQSALYVAACSERNRWG